MDAGAVNRVESAGPGPLTPAGRVEAWECGPAGVVAAADSTNPGCAPTEQDSRPSRVMPSALLAGDAVVPIPEEGSGGSVGAAAAAGRGFQGSGSASAEMRSPRSMAADTRWSVKWVSSWTGATSPRSPLASPRNLPPAGAGTGADCAPVATGAASGGETAPLQDVRSFEPAGAEAAVEVVGVGRRGIVEAGNADDGTVMWSRSVPRTPASAASAASLSGVVPVDTDGVAADLSEEDADDQAVRSLACKVHICSSLTGAVQI